MPRSHNGLPKPVLTVKEQARRQSYKYRKQPEGYIYGRKFSGADAAMGVLDVDLDFEVARVDCAGRAILAACVRIAGLEEDVLEFHVAPGRCKLHFARYRDCTYNCLSLHEFR